MDREGWKNIRPIRRQVIRSWLDAKSRDEIAQELEISTGAVSGIIGDFRKDDPHGFADTTNELLTK